MGKELFIEGLKALEYSPEILSDNKVSFDYEIQDGNFKGTKIKLGFEIPPDFNSTCPTGPHINPRLIPLNPSGTGNDRAVESPQFGDNWQYLSRPYPANGWPRTNKSVYRYLHFIKNILETL